MVITATTTTRLRPSCSLPRPSCGSRCPGLASVLRSRPVQSRYTQDLSFGPKRKTGNTSTFLAFPPNAPKRPSSSLAALSCLEESRLTTIQRHPDTIIMDKEALPPPAQSCPGTLQPIKHAALAPFPELSSCPVQLQVHLTSTSCPRPPPHTAPRSCLSDATQEEDGSTATATPPLHAMPPGPRLAAAARYPTLPYLLVSLPCD
ncbi:hypothetical protein BC567DRAFT_25481 [Phyllosticta citribraziliensis]